MYRNKPDELPGRPFSGCGIFGAVVRADSRNGRIDQVDWEAMRASLAHRGPDDSDLWIERDVGLGHTRLSILDPRDCGRQPMVRGHFAITYNGEVYNYRELRTQLEGKGHRFTTNTDTEVVLYSFVEWGEACLERFNGMFAFAVWNSLTRELFLARDRVGIKPLYYVRTESHFVFASEAEALVRSGTFVAEVDPSGLAAQTLLRSYFEPDCERTLLKGLRLVRPGHFLKVNDTLESRAQAYWDFPQVEDEAWKSRSLDALAEEFMSLFQESVRLRLVSDAPIGAFLSGGMDSSLLNAVASQASGNETLASFTIADHSEIGEGETPAAQDLAASRVVASHFKEDIHHHEVQVESSDLTAELMRSFVDLAWLADDPRFIALSRNYRAIQQNGLKVVLNGQGPDETMGGYIRENPVARLGLQESVDLVTVKEVFAKLCLLEPAAMNPELMAQKRGLVEAAVELYCQQPGTVLRRGHLFLCRTLMHRTLLFEDFMSMRSSVECRVPFLDHRIVEFAFSVPFDRHISRDGTMGKVLLRQAGRRVLPDSIVTRVKQPFPLVNRQQIYEASLKIYQDHVETIRSSTIVGMVFQPGALPSDGRGLQLRDLWLINNLFLWEKRLAR